jgi:Ca2+/Na+ antiporter
MLPLLIRVWTKAEWERENKQSLVRAITIAWTLVLNVYLAIYDTILIVTSVLIATDHLGRKGLQNALGFRYLLVLLYLIPLITQPVARWTGIQLYTLALVAFGFYLLTLFGKGNSAVTNSEEVKPFSQNNMRQEAEIFLPTPVAETQRSLHAAALPQHPPCGNSLASL